ncbi:MAG: hypothetical protein ACKOIA_06895 [Acidimicrobiia bacterium]
MSRHRIVTTITLAAVLSMGAVTATALVASAHSSPPTAPDANTGNATDLPTTPGSIDDAPDIEDDELPPPAEVSDDQDEDETDDPAVLPGPPPIAERGRSAEHRNDDNEHSRGLHRGTTKTLTDEQKACLQSSGVTKPEGRLSPEQRREAITRLRTAADTCGIALPDLPGWTDDDSADGAETD